MEETIKKIHSDVRKYYSEKIAEYGATPRGVDWNGEKSQFTRFEQLSKVIVEKGHFSINDLGCGYGAYFDFLNAGYEDFVYFGYDISKSMIDAATLQYGGRENACFSVGSKPGEIADYCVASGIFNVRLERDNEEWWEYICSTLDLLDQTSRRGFSFNCLTSYSDVDKMKPYLFYADPCRVFDLCKRKYSRNVALLHDYDLYEFTILVKK